MIIPHSHIAILKKVQLYHKNNATFLEYLTFTHHFFPAIVEHTSPRTHGFAAHSAGFSVGPAGSREARDQSIISSANYPL